MGLFRRRRSKPPLQTVTAVDIHRYMGRWFEIARYPAWFQRKCVKNTIAEYALRPDGTVRIENRCTTAEGKTISAHGSARVADARTGAKLKVKFSPFMPAADYWIIDLDPEYGWAVVGEPKRRYLWILSRTPHLNAGVFASILQGLRDRHYQPERLAPTEQDGA